MNIIEALKKSEKIREQVLSVIKHGKCSVCQTEKTVFIYRSGDTLLPPICGQCELDRENGLMEYTENAV